MRAIRHWIIAHASADDPALQAELPGLALPALTRWLAQAQPAAEGHEGAGTLSPPHEQALARALGWVSDDGSHPWAAWHGGRQGVPCAWLVPCHWQISLDHIVLLPPNAVALSEQESTALRAAWLPLAQQDGLDVSPGPEPWRWLACGQPLAGWRSASLARVAHRRLDAAWQPGGTDSAARPLRRLLEEAVMLWHDHPVNRERAARGAPVINGLWVEGAGQWDGRGLAPHEATVVLDERLSGPALRGDVQSWLEAWQRLDTEVLATALQAAHDDAQPRWLTLCGDRGWRTWRLDPGAPRPGPRRRWWPWARRTDAAAATHPWWIGL